MNSKEKPQQSDNNARASGPTFNSLFRGVAVWRKITYGAIITPIMLLSGAILDRLIKMLPGNQNLPKANLDDPKLVALMLLCSVGVGAAVGGALALKEAAESQSTDQRGPSPFMRALFGFGKWSLLLFWVPITIAITLCLLIGMPA